MKEFNTCTECVRPEVCTARCECSIIVNAAAAVATHSNDEIVTEWITDRNRGAA